MEVVLSFIGDEDGRVRQSAATTLVKYVDFLCYKHVHRISVDWLCEKHCNFWTKHL